VKGLRKSNRGGEFDQSTLYTCMEISQLNSFVELIYANKKEKIRRENLNLSGDGINS
jgi:hypothetical protein